MTSNNPAPRPGIETNEKTVMNSKNQKRERRKLYLQVVFGKKRPRIYATHGRGKNRQQQ
jgi:hypothetical protein